MADENTQTPEPKVVKQVKEEIAAFGENIKGNYDELRKAHEALKLVVDQTEGKFDTLVEGKIVKLGEDITTRQADLDAKMAIRAEEEKKLTERMDSIEVALKRTPNAVSVKQIEEAAKMESEAAMFAINAAVVSGQKQVTWEHAKKLTESFNIDEYKAYTSAFTDFLRTNSNTWNSRADQIKALSIGIDPDGGYTVTPVMSNRIVTRLFEADPIRQLASVETISTDAIEWLVDYGEAGWGWEAETVAGDETDTPQLFKKRIPVHIMYAKPRASQSLLEDSAINIENWLADKVSNRFMRGEGAAFVGGDGVGKPRGFLTYDGYDTAGTDQWGRIEQQNMGAAAAVTADGFIDVMYRLIEQYLQRASWLMNRLTVAATMQLKDGQGNYIWKPGLTEERNSTILGLDVRMSTTMPVVAAGALSVAIADWTEAYMVVDRLGITIQRDPFTQKPMIEFYTRKRVGGDVINFQAIKIGVIAA